MTIENQIVINLNNEDFTESIVYFQGECFFYKNSGLTRHVFANKDKTKVIKIPIEDIFFNIEENDIYQNASDEVKEQFAITELKDGYIIQEFLYTLDDPETEKWLGRGLTIAEIKLAMSCRSNVGFDKNFKLKVYDLHEYKKY